MEQPGGKQVNEILSQSPAPCNQATQLSLPAGKAPTGVKANANPANHHEVRLLSKLRKRNCRVSMIGLAALKVDIFKDRFVYLVQKPTPKKDLRSAVARSMVAAHQPKRAAELGADRSAD